MHSRNIRSFLKTLLLTQTLFTNFYPLIYILFSIGLEIISLPFNSFLEKISKIVKREMRVISVIVLLSMSLCAFSDQQSKDFCEAFADNGFRISYGYSYAERSLTYLFIGHHYWQVISRSKDVISLYSNRSKIIENWFGGEYKIAIDIKFWDELEDWKWMTGLLKVS